MPATVVLMIDGLPANLPGPYGNTTVDTPTLNRFAAESELFDFCFVESPRLEDTCPILWKDIVGEGSVLVSDDADVLQIGAAHGFDSIIDASGPQGSKLVTGVSQTQTANFFIHAIEALQNLEEDGLCWLHHRGLTGLWDAPWELRQSFADEEDPDPPLEIERPQASFDSKEIDPDVLLGYQQSAYAQLVVVDQLFGAFLEQLTHSGLLDNVSLVFAAPRGYPLGEHGIVGEFNNLYNETIHVPLMVRKPRSTNEAQKFGCRHQGKVQLRQLNQMIGGLLDGGFHTIQFCETAVSQVGNLRSLQNDQWKLICGVGDNDRCELFAKPDDRWDINDVSRRCPDVVEELADLVSHSRI